MRPDGPHVGNIVLGLSFLAGGLALYLALVRVRRAVRVRVLWELFYALLDVGMAGILLLLAWRLFGMRSDIVPSAPVVLYGSFLVMIIVGLFGIAYSQGVHDKRSTDREGVQDG